MAVGDVHGRDGGEDRRDPAYILLPGDQPEMVPHSIDRYEIVLRRAANDPFHDGIKLVVLGIGEEYRLDIGIVHPHVLHTVFLLVAACQLMLLDPAGEVVVHAGAQHQAVLCFAVHGLAIDIVILPVVLHQPPSLLKQPEILRCFQIDILIMFIFSHREIDLRLDDMIQRLLIAGGFSAGFR